MVDNPLQFAVVREDPAVELELLGRLPEARRVLLIASGGCTALALRVARPELELTLIDPNPAQLALVEQKLEAVADADQARRARAFGVGNARADSLVGRGNFESLFRTLRQFLHEFVLPYDGWQALFARAECDKARLEGVFASKYWPVAFELAFADSFLRAMFGPAAVQHAPPGSYPVHFRAALERGLRAPGGGDNRFLHHILLGHYLDRPACLPPYLKAPWPGRRAMTLTRSDAFGAATYEPFDLVDLSNILDWSSEEEVAGLARRLSTELKPGAALIYRQLNHAKDFSPLFGGRVRFDARLGEELLAREQSLFYSKLVVGFRL